MLRKGFLLLVLLGLLAIVALPTQAQPPIAPSQPQPFVLIPTPNPERPDSPPNRPVLEAPSSVPTELWCGFGCGNHIDRLGASIQSYYATDYGRVGALTFPIVASAAGHATQFVVTGILLGSSQAGCPVDLDPNLDGTQGHAILIDHGNGWSTFYLHMSEVTLPPDGQVNAGDIIGIAGCTGSNSIHLHFDLRWRDADGTSWTYPPDFITPLPAPSVDLVLLIDTTASMGDDIDAAKASAQEIVSNLKEQVPDSRIAVVDFRDFPSRTGASYDYPYRDALGFTFDEIAAINAINGLSLGFGGDTAETLNCALMHVMNADRCAGRGFNTTLGPWRPISSKSIIYLTDAPALSPEPFTDFTNESVIAAGNAGGFVLEEGDIEEGYRGDPEVPGIVVYPIVVGGSSLALEDAEEIAAGTGGQVFTADSADEVVQAIIDAIDEVVDPTDTLYLPLTGR